MRGLPGYAFPRGRVLLVKGIFIISSLIIYSQQYLNSSPNPPGIGKKAVFSIIIPNHTGLEKVGPEDE